MDSITQKIEELLAKYIEENQQLKALVSKYISPATSVRSVVSWAELNALINDLSVNLRTDTLKQILESMDKTFRTQPGRSSRYYVKQTRKRLIVTMLGEVTYNRTEYIDRLTSEPYIYVDEQIGLLRRQRFDSCVRARAVELYSDQNSMIKVGRILAEQIFGFSVNKDRSCHAISRQQVFNMLNVIPTVITPVKKNEKTPETIYIMADEKYIDTQQVRRSWIEQELAKGRSKKEVIEECEQKHFDEMVKMGVIFTGREEMKDKNGKTLKRPRWKLTGKYHVAWPQESSRFWPHVHDVLQSLFDMEQVKHIYILGDGASWIRNGVQELRTSENEASFAFCRFHGRQAINKITKDPKLRSLLFDYLRHGSRNDLIKTIDSIVESDPGRKEIIEQKKEYLLSNMAAAVVMEEKVRIGCSMEQAIQHVLSSPFTSVPKAYAPSHLHTYVLNRMTHENHLDVQNTLLAAFDLARDKIDKKNFDGTADLSKENYDLGIFEKKADIPYYHADLSTVIQKHA